MAIARWFVLRMHRALKTFITNFSTCNFWLSVGLRSLSIFCLGALVHSSPFSYAYGITSTVNKLADTHTHAHTHALTDSDNFFMCIHFNCTVFERLCAFVQDWFDEKCIVLRPKQLWGITVTTSLAASHNTGVELTTV